MSTIFFRLGFFLGFLVGDGLDLRLLGSDQGGGGRDFRQRLVKEYRKALHLAGIQVRTLKDLRHSFDAILLNELGEDIRYAQSQLRHTTLAMTADRYGHPDRLNDPLRVDRIDVLGGLE